MTNVTNAPLFISILEGTARTKAGTIPLSPLQREIVFALAYGPPAAEPSQLAESLWPDADVHEAENCIYVAIYRLRRRLADPTSIERTAAGYRLGRHVVCDLPEIEAGIRRLTRARKPADGCGELEALRERLAAATSRAGSGRPVAEAIGRRAADALHAITTTIGQSALASGQFERALEFARAAIERDACDESALELALRAHLGLRDRAAAMRAYRSYAATLARELQLQPSAGIRELLR